MASATVQAEITRELKLEAKKGQPLGKALWDKKLKEGPGSTPKTKHLYKRCRWAHTAGGEYTREEIKISLERARLYTEAHKVNAGEVPVMIRAKSLEHYLKNCSIYIQDEEIIVGNHNERPDKMELYPEGGAANMFDYLEDDTVTPPELYDEGVEMVEYWKQWSLSAMCERYMEPEDIEKLNTGVIGEPPVWNHFYTSACPPYQSVLEDGLEKRIEWCEQNIRNARDKLKEYPWRGEENIPLFEKIDNWTAMVVAAKAVIGWARRYSRLAKTIAEEFDLSDSVVGAQQRKKELLETAEICYNVPAKPARGFKDAMQSKWFSFEVAQNIERYGSGYSHLEDDLMWPYYKASVIDKTAQPMTRDEAIELLESERLKVSERGVTKGRWMRIIHAGINDLHIMTLGGLDENGKDMCNDLTDAILEATLNIHTNEPSVAFKYSPKINEKTRRLVFECISQGYGFPSIKHHEKNTRHSIEYHGWPPEVAARWALVLCMAPGVTGRRSTQHSRNEGGSGIVGPAVGTMALSDGFDSWFSHKQVGAHTGDASKFTWEDLLKAVETQLKHNSHLMFMNKEITSYAEGKRLESPFLAVMDDWNVEEGVGAYARHKPYSNTWADYYPGPMGVVDDLAAIKYWVFDQKKYTMAQLLEALQANWQGYEDMRQEFLAAPKWGNDDDYVDEIASWFMNMSCDVFQDVKMVGGEKGAQLVPQSVSSFVTLGSIIGAEPFGRRHGESLHDGGCSPYMGLDKKGPTAVLKSVSKLPNSRIKGDQLNQRLPVSLMRESEKGFDAWSAYMKTWHDLGIDHVQFNVVRTEDMRAAQKEPEKWEHLIVRIAGYSARFISLSQMGQDAIIGRNVQELG
ncbi:formate C-acetyltransferase/glycerol dehydratase family glycyl radical enzyme [Paradesulfitobacterium aromaticivorans]